MEILNRKLIKAEARNFISQDKRWLSMALACLPLILISGAISGGFNLVLNFSDSGDVSTQSFSGGSSIVSWLLIPFTIGMAGYFLNHLRGLNPDWKSLYREGLDNYGNYFKVGVVTQLVIFLWSLLFIIPGIIKGYEYYFVHQIMHDNPNLGQKQARDLSKRMTDGFKSEIFVMNISFILWYILTAFTLGIAYLFVGPYIACTSAMYYENLKHNALMTGIARPEEFGIMPVQEEPETNGYEPAVTPSYIENEVTEIQTPEDIEEAVETEVLEEDPAETQEEQTDIEE